MEILASLNMSSVDLVKLFNLSWPQFSHLYIENNISLLVCCEE